MEWGGAGCVCPEHRALVTPRHGARESDSLQVLAAGWLKGLRPSAWWQVASHEGTGRRVPPQEVLLLRASAAVTTEDEPHALWGGVPTSTDSVSF